MVQKLSEDILTGLEKTTAYLLERYSDTNLTKELIAFSIKTGVEKFGMKPNEAICAFAETMSKEFGSGEAYIPADVAGEMLGVPPDEVIKQIKNVDGATVVTIPSWLEEFFKKE